MNPTEQLMGIYTSGCPEPLYFFGSIGGDGRYVLIRLPGSTDTKLADAIRTTKIEAARLCAGLEERLGVSDSGTHASLATAAEFASIMREAADAPIGTPNWAFNLLLKNPYVAILGTEIEVLRKLPGNHVVARVYNNGSPAPATLVFPWVTGPSDLIDRTLGDQYPLDSAGIYVFTGAPVHQGRRRLFLAGNDDKGHYMSCERGPSALLEGKLIVPIVLRLPSEIA